MNLVIIDYGSGNLRSVENAFKNSVSTNKLNFKIQVTNELELISSKDSELSLTNLFLFLFKKNDLI